MPCQDCKFHNELESECRAHPPRVLLFNKGEILSAWPTVEPTDSCGEWQRTTSENTSLAMSTREWRP